MIHVTITPPLLVTPETWESTVIVVSANADLSLPLVDTVEDNLLNSTEFNYPIEVVNGQTYYAQARYILSPGGLQGKSVITSFVADNSVEFNVELFYPLEVGKVTVTTDFPDNSIDHPHMFSNFKLVPENDVDVKHTTWVIEDAVTHDVLFVSVEDTDNIYDIHLNRFLSPDKLYTIRASMTTRAGITSAFFSTSFRTAPIKDPFMIIGGSDLGWFESIYTIGVTVPKPFDTLDVELYDDNHLVEAFVSIVNPIDLTEKPEFKMGRVRANYSDGTQSTWRYAYSVAPYSGGEKDGYIYEYPFNYPVKSQYTYIYEYPYPYGYGSLLNACKADKGQVLPGLT